MTVTDEPPVTPRLPAPDELLALPGGGLRIWPEAVLRGAGFAVSALTELGDPAYAAAVDAMTDQEAREGGAVVEAAERRQHELLCAIAARADFQEAVAWQNPEVLRSSVRPLAASPAAALNQAARRKERIVAKYWARYCAKNDTIGFFGPVCWVTLRPDGPLARIDVGEALINRHDVHLEPWAADALAAVFSADPAVRPWIAPRLNPSAFLHAQQVLRADGPPVAVDSADWRLLCACDGRRPARELAAELVAGAPDAFPDEGAVFRALDRLVEAGHVRWDLEPPLVPRSERMLRAAVETLGDSGVRSTLTAALDQLDEAVARVGAAAGVDELDDALERLDETFTGLTGAAPQRRSGETYGGRRLVLLESNRDAGIAFGPDLLDRLGPPLSLLAWSVRGLTSELAACYEQTFLGAHTIIAASGEVERVWLAHLLGLCSREIFTVGQRVFEPILESFAERWEKLLGLDADAETRRTCAELWPTVRDSFPASGPGWIQAFQHGADIQICARSPQALADGDYRLVLGELHAAWNTIEAGVFVQQHPEPERLAGLLTKGLPAGRVVLVPVKHHPRVLARTMPAIADERQWWLSLTGYPGGDPDRRVSLAELWVWREADGMWCQTADGRARFRIIDVLGMLISAEIMDAFKLIGARRDHVPRTWVDGLVVTRESWSVPLSDLGLPGNRATEAMSFRTVRKWAAGLGLPRFVFVKVPGELKPFYLDLASSTQVASLVTALRRAVSTRPASERLHLTEMLPTPEDAWLPGPGGERYLSELRLQLVDSDAPW